MIKDIISKIFIGIGILLILYARIKGWQMGEGEILVKYAGYWLASLVFIFSGLILGKK